jgi:hypothetical protein
MRGSSSQQVRPGTGDAGTALPEPFRSRRFVLGSPQPLQAFPISWARRGHGHRRTLGDRRHVVCGPRVLSAGPVRRGAVDRFLLTTIILL